MTVQQTGTLIVEGLEQGARDALFTLHVVAGGAVSVLIIGFLFAAWLICRAEAKRAKAERDRKRVRTYLEIDGLPVEFEVTNLREAA